MNINTIAKYVDQPIIINSLQRKLPQILTAGAAGFCTYDTIKTKRNESKEKTVAKNIIIMASTVGATLFGVKGLTIKNHKIVKGLTIKNHKIVKGLLDTKPLKKIIEEQTKAVKKYTENINLDNELKKILEKAQKNRLNIREIETILKKLPESAERKELFKGLAERESHCTFTHS